MRSIPTLRTAQELHERLKNLSDHGERESLLDALAEIKAIEDEQAATTGFSGLTPYLTRNGYDEEHAQQRIDVIEIFKIDPELMEKLRVGRLNIDQVSEVARVLRASRPVSGNKLRKLLLSLEGQSFARTQNLVAGFFNVPVRRMSSRRRLADGSVEIRETIPKELVDKISAVLNIAPENLTAEDILKLLEGEADRIIRDGTH